MKRDSSSSSGICSSIGRRTPGDTELVGAETIDLDKAVGEALAFAAKDGRTLVIVVGGPEASGMTLVGGNLADGKAEAKWTMPGMIHTGTMVPVFAFGPGAEAFQGIQEDTALFEKMKNALLESPKHLQSSRKQCFLLLHKLQGARSSASRYSAKCRTQEAALLVTPQIAGRKKQRFSLLRKMQETFPPPAAIKTADCLPTSGKGVIFAENLKK